MKIISFALDGNRGWPDLELGALDAGLNVFCGPTGSSKTAVADLLSHALYGRRLSAVDSFDHLVSPEGELIVENRGRKYRLRRYQDNAAADRLTVAALDGSAVDQDTVRQLVAGLSPSLLAPLFVAGFREPPQLEWLLSDEFAREFQSVIGDGGEEPQRTDQDELVARRDALAQELESRLAGERQRSHELDDEWHELDRVVHELKQEIEGLRDQLWATETELAEVDAWLRYRDLGATAAQRWRDAAPNDSHLRLAELDEQIDRWRQTLADMERRQASVQARMAGTRPGEGAAVVSLADQRAWLGLSRELVADLQGEVARFARASESNLCVCGDAHPRLRPIVETLRRQLDSLSAITEQQEQAIQTADLHGEAEHLARSQAELRGQLEHLLNQRQALGRSARPSRVWEAAAANAAALGRHEHSHEHQRALWDGATTEHDLAVRRAELQHTRAALHERLTTVEPQLRELRARRDAIERERAAVLSTGKIKKLQRELAKLQSELEQAASGRAFGIRSRERDGGRRASDFLAQLSDGELVRLQLGPEGRGAHVVNRAGRAVEIESLSAAEHDQVYLSLCLALVTACGRHGVQLPLVLDEPFLRLDHRATAALAAVLDDFGRRGHQVLIFTGQREAAERFGSLGAARHHMADLQRRTGDPALAVVRHVEGPAERPAVAKTQAEATRPEQRRRAVKRRSAGKSEQEHGRRFYLEPLTNVVHAPSIGPKTAQRLANAGIYTVADLLAADPAEAARELAAKNLTPEVVRSWQRQARLVCQVPQLRQHDAQILVGSGFTRAEQIAEMKPAELLAKVTAYCATSTGEKILGENARPDLALVTKWISRAGHRRKLDAA
jgi:predicted flap endonuclease-1-like 5' DNA nuclease/predicted  nucleic acid-binding Zn-ribbon protein